MQALELGPKIEGSQVEFITGRDGIRIPVRIFGKNGKGTPVLILHGLKSHSGWFVQSAAFIASRGASVYAVDRRGSGLSEVPRGACDSFQEMIDDVKTTAEHVMDAHGKPRVHLLGHCFGAIPATAFACTHPDMLKSLILATPGLHTKTDLKLREKLLVAWSKLTGRETRIPFRLEPEMFSELDECVSFIQNDELALNDATGSFFFEVLRARRFIKRQSRKLTMPVFMACAGRDQISDNAKNRTFFEGLRAIRKTFLEYPRARHILEFSSAKDEFFADLSRWLEEFEERNNGPRGSI